ncbi:Uncharacterized protein FKW44_011397, partial [Caligus rogercresseyi]
ARSLQGSIHSSSSLADRMRGLRHDVQRRLSRFRSRSAERISNKSKRSSRSPPNRRMTTSSIPVVDDYLSLNILIIIAGDETPSLRFHHRPSHIMGPLSEQHGPLWTVLLVPMTLMPYDLRFELNKIFYFRGE